MTANADGRVYTTGFDDKLREVDPAAGFTCVLFFPITHVLTNDSIGLN